MIAIQYSEILILETEKEYEITYKDSIQYARQYKPRLIFYFTQFSLQLRLILQTIYVLKAEILQFLSLKSAAYKRERPMMARVR